MDKSREYIFKTLLYSDIFDYPLKKEEIWQFLISSKKENKNVLETLLKKYKVPFYKSFYFLGNRKNTVSLRIGREKVSEKKLRKAKKVIKLLGKIPTVYFIGISGALSMSNCKEDDDIDIFVICENNFVWTTRLFMVLILILLGVYRKKNDKDYSDKICLNLIASKNNMIFFKNKQNLYLAHEIVQLLPILDKNSTYKQFINKNKWVLHYLPNSLERITKYRIFYKEKSGDIHKRLFILFEILHFEKLAKFLQWNYMKKDITIEKINDNLLAFHPIDYGNKIMEIYNKRKFENVL